MERVAGTVLEGCAAELGSEGALIALMVNFDKGRGEMEGGAGGEPADKFPFLFLYLRLFLTVGGSIWSIQATSSWWDFLKNLRFHFSMKHWLQPLFSMGFQDTKFSSTAVGYIPTSLLTVFTEITSDLMLNEVNMFQFLFGLNSALHLTFLTISPQYIKIICSPGSLFA